MGAGPKYDDSMTSGLGIRKCIEGSSSLTKKWKWLTSPDVELGETFRRSSYDWQKVVFHGLMEHLRSYGSPPGKTRFEHRLISSCHDLESVPCCGRGWFPRL